MTSVGDIVIIGKPGQRLPTYVVVAVDDDKAWLRTWPYTPLSDDNRIVDWSEELTIVGKRPT